MKLLIFKFNLGNDLKINDLTIKKNEFIHLDFIVDFLQL